MTQPPPSRSLPFQEATFVTSALRPEECPSLQTDGHDSDDLPEVALLGRSNVGKSSLINHLLRRKNLVKISTQPGKTQRINYFLIDQSLFLVDLPGYGFARVKRSQKQAWGTHIENYLNRAQVKAALLLIDSRHGPMPSDQQMLNYAQTTQLPLIIILTKSDKLSPNQRQIHCLKWQEMLNEYDSIPYSVKEGGCRRQLIEKICRVLWD